MPNWQACHFVALFSVSNSHLLQWMEFCNKIPNLVVCPFVAICLQFQLVFVLWMILYSHTLGIVCALWFKFVGTCMHCHSCVCFGLMYHVFHNRFHQVQFLMHQSLWCNLCFCQRMLKLVEFTSILGTLWIVLIISKQVVWHCVFLGLCMWVRVFSKLWQLLRIYVINQWMC